VSDKPVLRKLDLPYATKKFLDELGCGRACRSRTSPE
jgi:hypothetical protein